MPKVEFIDPKTERKADSIHFDPIPVNTYNKSLEEEKDHFTPQEFLNIYRDMLIIREFETMLNDIKISGEYKGIAYNHPGPAHLSIGQEASAVGMAFLLLNARKLAFRDAGAIKQHSSIPILQP